MDTRLTNAGFLRAISLSFEEFIRTGTSRSTNKLKPLHGAIARDIATRLGEGYHVVSQGYAEDREEKIQGRYYEKAVDITVSKDGTAVCGIAVKFIMQNYSQNNVNYFENMLGETANIRSNRCPYFQVFIVLDKLPYYKRGGEITKWETFTSHNSEKYVVLSRDDTDTFFHTPNKTLVYVVHVPDAGDVRTQRQYMDFYRGREISVVLSDNEYDAFDEAVIFNDYETFMDKVYHTILSQ